jgi:predicted ABC-type exoprotein transport system permease subunit
MRSAVALFASLGIVTALVFVVGPLIYSSHLPLVQVITPICLAAFIGGTHALMLRRVRYGRRFPTRWALLVPNVVLFLLFTAAAFYLSDGPFRGHTGYLLGYLFLYNTPFLVNLIYLFGFDAPPDMAANNRSRGP